MPSEIEQDFEQFWQLSTRKKAKGYARLAYMRARKKATKEEIHEAYRRYGIETADYDPHYIAHPASWLNAERWEDEADMRIAPRARTVAEGRYSRAMSQLARDALEKPDTRH